MPGRRLSAEDRLLWGRLAATVRPLKQGVAKISPSADRKVLRPRPPQIKDTVLPASPVRAEPRPVGSRANTLDGGWDRNIARGIISPDFTIDLHGETLSSAHARLNRSLAAAVRQQARVILLITGKPAPDNPRLPPTSRGVIRASVGDWLAASAYSDQIAAVRNAHPRHGGAGALYLILRRSR